MSEVHGLWSMVHGVGLRPSLLPLCFRLLAPCGSLQLCGRDDSRRRAIFGVFLSLSPYDKLRKVNGWMGGLFGASE